MRASSAIFFFLCITAPAAFPFAQPGAPATGNSIQQSIEMAGGGHCKQAVPLLKRQLPQVSNAAIRSGARIALVRCAMALDEEQLAVETLLAMKHDAPGDPEVLYLLTHYFSELGMRAAQQLQASAPSSFQARKLEAEGLESQGKVDEAAAIYTSILEANPKVPGIHYRLGQIALAKAGASGPTDQAKVEFGKELIVDPSNASAEFILGELARRGGEWQPAIEHFSRAAKLDAGFSEAYLALGMSLVASGKFADAAPPLESYVRMQPEDPAGHYQLAIAYARTGNKTGAAREIALQTQAASRAKTSDTDEGHSLHP